MAEPVFDREHYLEEELGKVVGKFKPKEAPLARVRRWLAIAAVALVTVVALWALLADQSNPGARMPRFPPAKAPPPPPEKPVPIRILPSPAK